MVRTCHVSYLLTRFGTVGSCQELASERNVVFHLGSSNVVNNAIYEAIDKVGEGECDRRQGKAKAGRQASKQAEFLY